MQGLHPEHLVQVHQQVVVGIGEHHESGQPPDFPQDLESAPGSIPSACHGLLQFPGFEPPAGLAEDVGAPGHSRKEGLFGEHAPGPSPGAAVLVLEVGQEPVDRRPASEVVSRRQAGNNLAPESRGSQKHAIPPHGQLEVRREERFVRRNARGG